MTALRMPDQVRLIPIDRIQVLNHRERNSKAFEEIKDNIRAIGLKKPITVASRHDADGQQSFALVCGEGRLKAFKVLGQQTIPALVIEASDEDAFIMSLTENIARRQCKPLELIASINALREQGYDRKTIAQKTGLTADYVSDVLNLLKHGEEKLLIAVYKGQIPVTTAMRIAGAGADSKAIQAALQHAYECENLRGRQLIEARRVLERRLSSGKSAQRSPSRKRTDVTPLSLVRTYQKEVERQRLLVRKAEFTQQRLLFVAGALRELFSDESFINLMRAEGLDTLPKYLADRINSRGVAA